MVEGHDLNEYGSGSQALNADRLRNGVTSDVTFSRSSHAGLERWTEQLRLMLHGSVTVLSPSWNRFATREQEQYVNRS